MHDITIAMNVTEDTSFGLQERSHLKESKYVPVKSFDHPMRFNGRLFRFMSRTRVGIQDGNSLYNIQRAMDIGEDKLSVPAVMEVEDMAFHPEERSCMTYVSAFCHLPEVKAGGAASSSSAAPR